MQHKPSDTTMVAGFIPRPQSVRSLLCSYSKTAAHQYFVSEDRNLFIPALGHTNFTIILRNLKL